MPLFTLIVFIAFLAIVFIMVPRVLRVFSGKRLFRIAGATLFVADVFVALTAVLGGITLAAGADKFPPAWLAGTVFSSYLIPGLILAVVVGGSATAATFATLTERDAGTLFSGLAGEILLGWLAGERLILPRVAFSPQFWWLEAIYVAAGLLMLVPAAAIRLAGHKSRSLQPRARQAAHAVSNGERQSTTMSETSPQSPSQLSTSESSYSLPSQPQRRRKPFERVIAKAFVGRGGIRVAWRLAIFLAIVVGLIAGLSFIARTFFHVKPPTGPLEPLSLLHNEGVACLIILFAGWVMSRIEHRRIADYGLPMRRAFRRQFWLGILFGFAAITVLLGGMRLAGVFRFGTIGLRGFELLEYGAVWGLAFLLVGVFEEFCFRGYALFTLTTGMTFWPSAILSSVLFGLIHLGNSGESQIGAVEAGGTGLLFCLLLRRTGDLWMPIGFHAAWNWGQTYFYGVPDSGLAAKGHLFNPTFSGPAWLTGGSVGPEGSLLSIAVLVVLWSIFALWLREKKYPNPDAIRFPRGASSALGERP